MLLMLEMPVAPARNSGWVRAFDALPHRLRSLGLKREAVLDVVVVKLVVLDRAGRVRAGLVYRVSPLGGAVGEFPALLAGHAVDGADFHWSTPDRNSWAARLVAATADGLNGKRLVVVAVVVIASREAAVCTLMRRGGQQVATLDGCVDRARRGGSADINEARALAGGARGGPRHAADHLTSAAFARIGARGCEFAHGSSRLFDCVRQFTLASLDGQEEVAQRLPLHRPEVRALAVGDLPQGVVAQRLDPFGKAVADGGGNGFPAGWACLFQLALQVVND